MCCSIYFLLKKNFPKNIFFYLLISMLNRIVLLKKILFYCIPSKIHSFDGSTHDFSGLLCYSTSYLTQFLNYVLSCPSRLTYHINLPCITLSGFETQGKYIFDDHFEFAFKVIIENVFTLRFQEGISLNYLAYLQWINYLIMGGTRA